MALCRPVVVIFRFGTHEASALFTSSVRRRTDGDPGEGFLLTTWPGQLDFFCFVSLVGCQVGYRVLVLIVGCIFRWLGGNCLLSGVVCRLLTVNCQVSLLVVLVGSLLSAVGFRALVVDCQCRLSLSFFIRWGPPLSICNKKKTAPIYPCIFSPILYPTKIIKNLLLLFVPVPPPPSLFSQQCCCPWQPSPSPS